VTDPARAPRIRALLFDFDGMILDTESPAFASWQEVFVEHGHELTRERWAAAVGTLHGFDALEHLEGLVGTPLDREAIRSRRVARKDELVALEVVRPGVVEYLEGARRRGLALAIVSSDSREWVQTHLARLGLDGGWAGFFCADGDRTRANPSPVLYREAMAALGVAAGEGIAFEDSPNGIRAAKRAGLFCVAVPNPVTEWMDLGEADLMVPSLADLPLDELLARVGE
jgi:HAD superfamily hydrolase (TIGR01509 family)